MCNITVYVCVCVCVYVCVCVCVCVCMCVFSVPAEFLIGFKELAKLAQKWLVCASLGINLEPINKQLMLLVII